MTSELVDGDHVSDVSEVPNDRTKLTRPQAWNLYISHAFSTWNARGYEFAVILFTAAAYPDTLLATSVRTTVVYFSLILFSSSVGHWVEISADRLRTLATTIIVNRGSVMIASIFWLLVLRPDGTDDTDDADGVGDSTLKEALKPVFFTAAVLFGIIERLSLSGNLISMERDWVVTVAAPIGEAYDLTHLNAVMRRIDLVCKLIPPIFISAVISLAGSMRFGVVFTGLTSLVCLPIEILSARWTWKANVALQAPKSRPSTSDTESDTASKRPVIERLRQCFFGFKIYFSSSVWIPSMALALLHYNMMTWRATFITWLINVGFSLNYITLARTVGSIFEISSTILTPIGVAYLGENSRHQPWHAAVDDDDDDETRSLLRNSNSDNETRRTAQTIIGLQRFGLWGVTWQILNLVPVFLVIWAVSPSSTASHDDDTFPPLIGRSLMLFGFLASSRLGVWIFDLTTQQLTQTLVASHHRASFAGVENSVVNVFELAGAASAIVFPQIGQYKWLALASLVTVGISWTMYAVWVRVQRGHLFHWNKLIQGFCFGEERR